MSAIAGIWSFHAGSDAAADCGRMLRALCPPGSIECAQYAGTSLAMGRCLLRLLPEDSFDQQPLSATSVTAFIADVRLDNRAALAAQLNLTSEQSAVMADSAILLAAWQAWREDCLDHLCGAFSFAVWNETEQSLFLARDHTGERPLFYAQGANGFAFASMPKGLHPVPWVGTEIDEDYAAHFLAVVNTPIEQTIFRGIRRLPPGCCMLVRQQEIRTWRYWQTDRLPALSSSNPEDYLDDFRERFDAAVRARLRSAGKIASQLSGGLDSGAVTATAASMLRAQGQELACYTAVPRPAFNRAADAMHFYNEAGPAADVAAMYPNIRHILVESGATSFLDILDHNNRLYDHPCFGPTNEVWFNAILDRARDAGVSVMLNGNCGNSTFSDYGVTAFAAWFRSGQWSTLLRVARQLRKTGNASLRLILRNALGPSLPFRLRAIADPHMRDFSLDYSLVHPELARRFNLKSAAFRQLHQAPANGRNMLRSLLAFGDVSDVSAASRAGWHIDYRDPTFDRRIVEFCLTVPLEEFLRGGQLRSLARRGMQDRLPASTLQRTQRGNQSSDWQLSLAAVLDRMSKEEKRLRSSPLAARVLDLERMRWLIDHWPTGNFEDPHVKRSWHIALTRGLSVGRFLLQYDSGVRA